MAPRSSCRDELLRRGRLILCRGGRGGRRGAALRDSSSSSSRVRWSQLLRPHEVLQQQSPPTAPGPAARSPWVKRAPSMAQAPYRRACLFGGGHTGCSRGQQYVRIRQRRTTIEKVVRPEKKCRKKKRCISHKLKTNEELTPWIENPADPIRLIKQSLVRRCTSVSPVQQYLNQLG
ncbi:unnamed protein product [Urochloa humidicola]